MTCPNCGGAMKQVAGWAFDCGSCGLSMQAKGFVGMLPARLPDFMANAVRETLDQGSADALIRESGCVPPENQE